MINIDNYKLNVGGNDILSIQELTLPNKGLISLCGEIGCGKSSFAKSLISFYEYEGEIKFDGIDINDTNILEKIAYIPQNLEYFFLTNSIEEEVRLVCGDEINCFSHLMKKFNINELIDSNLDKLSGGEQMRVALFLNYITDAKMIILDETISMNDYYNLKKISEQVDQVKMEKLVLEISHDLDRISKAEFIIFIHGGEVYTFKDFKEFKENKIVNQVWSFNDKN